MASVTLTRLKSGQNGTARINALMAELEAAFAGLNIAGITGLATALDKAQQTTVVVANSGTPDGIANITGQVKDAEGNNLAGRFIIALFLGSAAYGDPTDLGTLTAKANSRLLKEITDDALAYVLTHSDGSWGVDLDTAADGTVHAHAAVAGALATASAAITGNP